MRRGAPVPGKDLAILIALVAIGAIATILVGERIGVHHGEGWDGRAYAAWSFDFPHEVLEHGITEYQAQRVLPSAAIYYVTELAGIAHTRPNMIAGFQLLDTLALVAAAAFLAAIARGQAWSRAATWAAFVAAFLGFANARHALYNPVLTDAAAFALGMGTTWAYLARRPIAQWLFAAVAAFTWPALLALGVACLLLPRAEPPPPDDGTPRTLVAFGFAFATVTFIAAWFVEAIVRPFPGTEGMLARSHHALWIPTIACIAAYSAAAAYVAARESRTWALRGYLRALDRTRAVLALAGIAAILVARWLWVGYVGRGVGIDLAGIQHLYAAYALRAPLWSLVHHVVYFGPIVLFVIAAWPRIAVQCATWGPAAVLGLGLVVLTAVTPESRHLNHVMPFAIVACITATADRWTPARTAGFAVLALAWSKLWLHIGYDEPHDPSAWPDLRYTMHHGPWATDATFLAHLAAAVVTAGLLVLLARVTRPPTA